MTPIIATKQRWLQKFYMNKISLMASLLLTASYTFALDIGELDFSDLNTAKSTDREQVICRLQSHINARWMKQRQLGVPMSELMANELKDNEKSAKENNSSSENLKRSIVALKKGIVDTYEVPIYETEQEKQKAVNEFANKGFSDCIKEYLE